MLLVGSGGGGASGGGGLLKAPAAVGLAIGEAVFADATGKWRLAQADAIGTTRAYGFITDNVTAAFAGFALNSGQLELTATQWDARTGETGGLTPGVQYFLSKATAGAITKDTSTLITGNFRVPVGKAVTTTRMAVQVDECAKL